MAKITKKEDYLEEILNYGVPHAISLQIDDQEILLAAYRMIPDPTDEEMVGIQNIMCLIDHMKSDEYKESVRAIYKEQYSSMDLDSLKFLYQATKVNIKTSEIQKAIHKKVEELINSLDFLVETDGGGVEDSTPKTLH